MFFPRGVAFSALSHGKPSQPHPTNAGSLQFLSASCELRPGSCAWRCRAVSTSASRPCPSPAAPRARGLGGFIFFVRGGGKGVWRTLPELMGFSHFLLFGTTVVVNISLDMFGLVWPINSIGSEFLNTPWPGIDVWGEPTTFMGSIMGCVRGSLELPGILRLPCVRKGRCPASVKAC